MMKEIDDSYWEQADSINTWETGIGGTWELRRQPWGSYYLMLEHNGKRIQLHLGYNESTALIRRRILKLANQEEGTA